MDDAKGGMKNIKDLRAGETVTGYFVVRKIEIKTKWDGSPYLLLSLGDSTGRISSTVWNEVKKLYDSIRVGDVVKVMGRVVTYKDSLQLSLERIRKASESEKIDKRNFVKRGSLDIEELWRNLIKKVESIKEPNLKGLLNRVFKNSELVNRFKEAPGGKLWHHAYLGGLLEHTMAVVEVCETMVRLYPDVDRDVLIAGALLHDIGKIDEYGYDDGFIDYTDEGRLWGHISMGAQMIRSTIDEMEKEEGFPVELKKHIIHLILSHQGELEHGSPVVPATLEAIILYYSDEMDSKANALKHVIERDIEPGRRWSQYIRLMDRFIYLGDREDLSDES